MFSKSLGQEFRTQMERWLSGNPEIPHQWEAERLTLSHPIPTKTPFIFRCQAAAVTIKQGGLRRHFRRRLFATINQQALKIRSYWINELISAEDRAIKVPELEKGQVAILGCNSTYGQVLTTQRNVFTGWGEVYHVFNNLMEANTFLQQQKKQANIKYTTYNEHLEVIMLP